jgi:hypothetical protein
MFTVVPAGGEELDAGVVEDVVVVDGSFIVKVAVALTSPRNLRKKPQLVKHTGS